MVIEKYSTTVTCVFCGRTRRITHQSDDGLDYDGHKRGRAESWTFDMGCECPLGKIEHEKTTIKPMCLNCISFRDGCCNNTEALKKISGMFDVGRRVLVKHPEKTCENHVLNEKIINRLLT